MVISICFKIPGEDVILSGITAHGRTVKELVHYLRSNWTVSCISGVYLNGRKIHIGGV